MDTKTLRRKVLDLAIQGRLVPQDPADEPAAVLLDRIRAEKARLVKEGKLKKSALSDSVIFRGEDNKYYEKVGKTITCIDEDIPFEIPEAWEWVRLKQICSMQAGKNISASKIYDEKTVANPYRCVGGNGLRGYTSTFNTEGEFAIVGRQGALCGCLNMEVGKFYATEHAVVVNSFGIIPTRFIYYFFTALNLNQYATATAQPGLAVSNINEVFLPLPPLAEQRRIVAKVEEVLSVVERYEKAQDALDALCNSIDGRLRKSILSEAIRGRLVPQDPTDEPASLLLRRIQAEKAKLVKEGKLKKSALSDSVIFRGEDNKYYERNGKTISCIDEEIPFEIPETWEWVRLKSIGEIITGSTPPKEQSKYYGGDVPFFKPTDLEQGKDLRESNDRLTELGFDQSRKLPPNSVLVTCIGATIGKTGKISVYGSCNQQINAIVPNSAVLPDFVYYTCNSSYMQNKIKSKASATTLPILNKNNFSTLLLPLPPLAEQHRIVAKVEEVFAVLDRLA